MVTHGRLEKPAPLVGRLQQGSPIEPSRLAKDSPQLGFLLLYKSYKFCFVKVTFINTGCSRGRRWSRPGWRRAAPPLGFDCYCKSYEIVTLFIKPYSSMMLLKKSKRQDRMARRKLICRPRGARKRRGCFFFDGCFRNEDGGMLMVSRRSESLSLSLSPSHSLTHFLPPSLPLPPSLSPSLPLSLSPSPPSSQTGLH